MIETKFAMLCWIEVEMKVNLGRISEILEGIDHGVDRGRSGKDWM